MKIIVSFLLGMVAGAFLLSYFQSQRQPVEAGAAASANLSDTARDAANTAATKTRAAATSISGSIADKMQAWHLTPEEIKGDLAKGGEIIRHNAARAGDKISDTRIATVIRAKYVLDRDLSVHDLDVTCKDGSVTLTGTVASEALLGRAVADALDTEGVQHVASKIVVAPRRP